MGKSFVNQMAGEWADCGHILKITIEDCKGDNDAGSD